MSLARRYFIGRSAIVLGGFAVGLNSCVTKDKNGHTEPSSLYKLKPMTDDVLPISINERKKRIEKAQHLMIENGFEALILDAGTSLSYFTDIGWGQSERTMVAIIPAKGEVKYVCPGFEENRLRELIKIGDKVYAWQEDENPYALIAQVLKNLGVKSGNIGIEEQMRFFIVDGIRKEAPDLSFISGDPVTIPCRIIKSDAELALMQKANDITRVAMQYAIDNMKEGMSPSDLSALVASAHSRLGARHAFGGGNFDHASAFPHGSIQPQKLRHGNIVLMDCGCKVEGYCSDISRTVVFGAEPTARQKEIWDLEKESQTAGFKAAQLGRPMHEIDDASRKILVDAGFGPDYKLPGLPHRTGHGIGMDVHEWGNAVKGNNRILESGMCFSIEPNISIIGEFGVRHEDCVYMTEAGPKWFSEPASAIDHPFS
jgi:Xaa-Pro dipeptidase